MKKITSARYRDIQKAFSIHAGSKVYETAPDGWWTKGDYASAHNISRQTAEKQIHRLLSLKKIKVGFYHFKFATCIRKIPHYRTLTQR